MKYIPDDTNWFGRGELFRTALNADQTEFSAMMESVVPLERGIRDDIVSDEHHSDIPEHTYTWQDEEAALDFLSGPLIAEIDRRIAILGDAYPFERVNSSLRYRGSSTLVYEFCLATSLQKNLSKKPFNSLPIIFELIAAEAARCYLGGNARSMRVGWPSHNYKDRPTKFSDLITLLNSNACGEFPYVPTISLPAKWNSHAPKDEGLDFVAWKSFDDFRLGQVSILGQCACGEDWETKLTDLQESRLRRWVNPVTYAGFTRAFAVPHHIPGHEVFADVLKHAGITFDRARLALLAHRYSDGFLELITPRIEGVISHTFDPAYS